MRVSARPSTAGSVSVTGPAVVPSSGGSPASTAASASLVPPSSRLVFGVGSVPVSAPTAIASGAEAGEPIVPLPGAAAPSLPAGAITSVPRPAAPTTASASGEFEKPA